MHRCEFPAWKSDSISLSCTSVVLIRFRNGRNRSSMIHASFLFNKKKKPKRNCAQIWVLSDSWPWIGQNTRPFHDSLKFLCDSTFRCQKEWKNHRKFANFLKSHAHNALFSRIVVWPVRLTRPGMWKPSQNFSTPQNLLFEYDILFKTISNKKSEK